MKPKRRCAECPGIHLSKNLEEDILSMVFSMLLIIVGCGEVSKFANLTSVMTLALPERMQKLSRLFLMA